MFYKIKRKCTATTILLGAGFAISMMSILIGVSAANSILLSLSEIGSDAPVLLTMQNSGLSFAISIYLFSIANCLVVTNYWIITRRRNMAICKAFGWSNYNLICSVIAELSVILLISLFVGIALTFAFSCLAAGLITISITPFFLCSTIALLLLTLIVSSVIPIARIMKIHPAEVIA